MDAVRYLKEKRRLTRDCQIDCQKCPLGSVIRNSLLTCTEFEKSYPKEAVDIIEKWAEENPHKTYLSVLLEKFPKTLLNAQGYPKSFCPYYLFDIAKGCPSTMKNNYNVCNACWDREYKEEE